MSKQPFVAENNDDEAGRFAGGYVRGAGLAIDWQSGPLGRPLGRGAERAEPNGAFVETVIAAAIQRIDYYNAGPFWCRENSYAITYLKEALHWLNHRTAAREERGVEGTHNV